MKRALVVLVLFVGHNSGLTVPSFGSKLFDGPTQLLNTSDLKPTTIQIDLENSNSIDEKELYQTGTDKENILNERAFIYINQQYKPLQRNQVYNSQRYNLNKDFMTNERLPQDTVIPHSSMTANINSLKQYFIPNVKGSNVFKSKYGPPNFKYMDREVKSRFTEDRYVHTKAAKLEAVTVKAVLRLLHKNPETTVDREVNSYKSANTKKHCEKSQIMTPYPRHRINYNYGFPSSFSWHGSAERNDDITLKDNNMSFEGSLANNHALSPLDLKDQDLLLDRYIKDALNAFDSNEILVKIDKKKCQNCKKGKSGPKCKCLRMNSKKPLMPIILSSPELQKSDEKLDENKQKEDETYPTVETYTSETLFPYGNDKIIGEESLSDILQ